MKKINVKEFGNTIINYGLLNGLLLQFKINFSDIKKIKVPGIKSQISLRKNTSDLPTFVQVFITQEYKRNFNNPKVIFDCGANIGLFSVYIKNKYPESTIIAVEPDPENFIQLQKNIQDYNSVFCENKGIWNKDTKLKVYDKFNSGKWGMVVEEDLESGNIQAISINSLMKKHNLKHIDLLKIDIETSEKQLFSDNYGEWLPLVKTIFIELHDSMEKGCSKSFFKAINESFENYKLTIRGENIIIDNLDFNKS